MKSTKTNSQSGFSIIEVLISMTIILVLLSIVSVLLGRSLGVRSRESRKTDALTSAQAALNIMSREIANAGFGIYDSAATKVASNGLITPDCTAQRIHLRTNIDNYGPRSVPSGSTVLSTNVPGEDVTYFFDNATDSIVRFDPNGNPQTSVVVNRISNVTFDYIDYLNGSSTPQAAAATASGFTGRIVITVTVNLEAVQGQPANQSVTFTSDVTLRNSSYMLNQY
jgi:prepilin-type N-terminal cleavage/methylation domain-containing protein